MKIRDIILEAAAGVDKGTVTLILQQNGYEQIKVSGNKVIALVQTPNKDKNQGRINVLNDILRIFQTGEAKQLKASIGRDSKISSIGFIQFEGSPVKVLVKDIGKQGDKSAGVANEIELATMLQSVVEKYGSANVRFVDPRGKELSLNDVTAVEVAGRSTAGRKKADINLISASGSLPISIKKIDAEVWESADKMFGEKAKHIIQNLKANGYVKLTPVKEDKRTYYKLSKEIVVEPTEEEAMNAIFGSDISPKGGIVIQTFEPQHYQQIDNNIVVNCQAVITSKEDIPQSHMMVWLIRNDSSRNNPMPGLRVLGVVLTRALGRNLSKDVIMVDKNGKVLVA